MATVLGAGSVLGTSLGGPAAGTAWFLDASLVSSASSASRVSAPGRRDDRVAASRAPVAPVDPPQTLDLLARVVWVLGTAAAGLSLSDLRAQLSESAESLQRALGAGLRTKRLRRVGAHNKLRYVLNA